MAEAEAKAADGGGNPLTRAADRIRASAQYLLGAFAAVGATLAAGLQLADIGDVSLVESPPRAVSKRLALRTRYDQQMATASHLERIRSDVLDVASYHRTRAAYEDAKTKIVCGAVAAALGIAAFAWGANGPGAVDIDPGEILPKSPSEVTVVLTDAGIEAFGDQLGSACDPSAVDAIAFAVDRTSYDVTTEQTEDRASVQLTVTDDLGAVVPRLESEADETGDAEPEAG